MILSVDSLKYRKSKARLFQKTEKQSNSLDNDSLMSYRTPEPNKSVTKEAPVATREVLISYLDVETVDKETEITKSGILERQKFDESKCSTKYSLESLRRLGGDKRVKKEMIGIQSGNRLSHIFNWVSCFFCGRVRNNDNLN